MAIGRWRGYLSILAAFLGGEDGAFGALTARGGEVVREGVTSTFDLTTPQRVNFDLPQVAGKKFIYTVCRIVFLTRDAALTTGPTFQLEQSAAAVSNGVAIPASTVNAIAAEAHVSASPTACKMVDMTTNPLQANLTVGCAGSGLTSCTGYIWVAGVYR